jgi:hypothetical protein
MIVKTLLACSASSLLLLAGAAQAADIGVLMADGSMVVVDTTANKVTKTMKVTGTTAPLVGIDASSGALVKQAPPNDGILNTVGSLGAKFDTIAFDIRSNGTKNEAWVLADGQLWPIDLATGKATAAGKIDVLAAGAKDIAILPKM